MQTLDCIKKRHSVRAFQAKEVPKELIEKIIEAGKAAPSAGGLKTQEFVLIKNKDEKEKITEIAYNQDFIAQAPVIIIVLVNEEKSISRYGSRGRFYCVCDGSAATENMLLAAVDLGLGSCWVGAFDENALKRLLRTKLKPIAILPIGYEK